MPNGRRCQSPAMRGHSFCDNHVKSHTTTRRGHSDPFEIPLIECPEAVQLAVHNINQALISGTIDVKKAKALFYGVSLASATLKHKPPPPDSLVYSITKSVHGDYMAPPLCTDPEGERHTTCTDCSFCNECEHPLGFDPDEPVTDTAESADEIAAADSSDKSGADHRPATHVCSVANDAPVVHACSGYDDGSTTNDKSDNEEDLGYLDDLSATMREILGYQVPLASDSPGDKDQSNYLTGQLLETINNLIPKTEAEMIARYGDNPFARKYFGFPAAAAPANTATAP
jgi:hypothetical protein